MTRWSVVLSSRLIAGSLLMVFLAPATTWSQTTAITNLPAELAAAIKRLHAAAVVVTADEVYVDRCGAEHRRDQVFRADFDGDGRQDYAALLRIGEAQASRTVQLWGVVFLAKRDGRYRAFVLFQETDAMFPSRQVLWVQPPGFVKHGAHPERVLTLKLPAVGSMLCESTARVFYWTSRGQTFREYLTRE